VPTDDPRLERALHDAAPAVTTSGVVTQVSRRRTQRRRQRRLAASGVALVVLLVVGTVAVSASRDDSSAPHVAAPGAGPQARVITGDGAVDDGAGAAVTPTRVVLEGDPDLLLRAPVLVGATALSVAGYDPGPPGVARSHDVRIDGTTVVDNVSFLATSVLSFAEGEGARWALTRNYELTGAGRVPDSFLKRIPASGPALSTPLPQDAEPVGPVAALGGAVWVPVRDGVLQFDPNGKLEGHIPLPDATNRWIAQVGKLAYVTDGRSIRSLDAAGGTSDTKTYGPEILGLASAGFEGRVLLAAEQGGLERARVARSTSDPGSPVDVTAVLPAGFVPTGLAASTTRIWATGTVDGSPAIALLGDDGVRATVVLEHASDKAALAWTSAHTVRIVTDGVLSEITVP
jgi:hypothetical protein